MDLNQITLDVRDLGESLAFYRLLGLRLIVLSPENGYARFELPSGSTTLSLHETPAAVAAGAALYFEVEDVDRRHALLQAAGVVFDTMPADQDWRWREAWFRDPTGHRLCLFHAGPDRRFPPWRLGS
ncbi:MAG: VOC family protein [Paracoccaceae bacterium]